jgi:hypothetical protein
MPKKSNLEQLRIIACKAYLLSKTLVRKNWENDRMQLGFQPTGSAEKIMIVPRISGSS